MMDYLADRHNLSSKSLELYPKVLFSTDILFDYEKVVNSDIESIINNEGIFKIISVIKCNDKIENHKEDIFSVYKDIVSMNPKYVEFNIISCDNMSEQLEKSLTNIVAYYSNNWYRYPEINAYTQIADKNISSADELVSAIEKQ